MLLALVVTADCRAKHKAIHVIVEHLPMGAQKRVSARVDDLDVNWLTLDICVSTEDVEHVRHAVLVELTSRVESDQASLARARLTDQCDFDLAPLVRIKSQVPCYRFLPLLFLLLLLLFLLLLLLFWVARALEDFRPKFAHDDVYFLTGIPLNR